MKTADIFSESFISSACLIIVVVFNGTLVSLSLKWLSVELKVKNKDVVVVGKFTYSWSRFGKVLTAMIVYFS